MKKKKVRRTQFSETFKSRAINLATNSKQSVSQTARELGISEKTLHGWLVGHSTAKQIEKVNRAVAEQTETEQLHAEIRTLKLQLEILRKAAIYFASEKDDSKR